MISSPQKTKKPVKRKEKVKVEKPKLKTPSIIKLKISSLNKLSCKPPEPPIKITANEAMAIDAAAKKIELANEVAMAQFSRPDKPSFLAEFNNPPPAEAKRPKIKRPKKPSNNSDKPKRGRPKTKKVASEPFKTSIPADEKPEGGNAMAQFSRPDKPSFLAEFNNPPPAEAKRPKIKRPKKPSNNSDKPKRVRPKTKKVASERFKTSIPADEKPEGGNDDLNTEVQAVINKSPPKKRIRKKKVNADFENFDTTSDSVEELEKKSAKKSTTTKKPPKPKIPKANTKKTDCKSKPRIRKPVKMKGKLTGETTANVGSLSLDNNRMKTIKPIEKEILPNDKETSPKCPSRNSSRESSECLSWANDISLSSSSTCITVASNNIVKLDNKLPYVQLTSIENFFKPDVDKYFKGSDSNSDSVTKCSLTTSPSNSFTQSLNLSGSSSSTSSSSTTTPSNSPIKESNIEDFDPKKLNLPSIESNHEKFDPTELIDFDLLKELSQGNFELNQSDRHLINETDYLEMETNLSRINQIYQDSEPNFFSDFLNGNVHEDITFYPEERAFEKGAKNLETTETNYQNTEEKSEANIKTIVNSEKKEANDIAIETEKNSNINNNIDENLKPAERTFELEYRNYNQEINATELAEASYNTIEACVPKQRTYEPLQRNNTKSDRVSKQRTYDYEPLERKIINDINGHKNIQKDHARAEIDSQDFDNFKDRVESPKNADKKEWYRQYNNKDTEKQTQDFDNTNEDPFQSPENVYKREYWLHNNNVTDDDDVLSLMAESISGLETNMMSNSTCAEPLDAEENIPQQAARPLMSINCKPVINESNSPKFLRIEFNREDNFENKQNKNIDFQRTILENPIQNQQNCAKIQVPFHNQRPMLLASHYTAASPSKCHFLRGVCYFNLVSNCRRQLCKFPHRHIDDAEALCRMSSCDNPSLIEDYMLIRNSPELRRKFGHCFAFEFKRRKMTRVLVEMIIDFTMRARADSSEDYNLRMVITEKALQHLNEVDLSTCTDLLVHVMSANNYLLCDKLMEEIAETQNFSRFKLVFVKLTDFMVGIFRKFSLSVASQILERVCILPRDPALIRAMWVIVMNTDEQIFKNSHMQHFENLLCNDQELYQRFLSKKQQVSGDQDIVTGLPMSREESQNMAVMQHDQHYMSATPEMDNLQLKDKRSLDDQPQNLKPPDQKIIRKGVYAFTAPKIPNFKIPSTSSSRQTSMEYRSPLQANGKFNYRGNRRTAFKQSMKKGAYNNKFLRRPGAGPSDY